MHHRARHSIGLLLGLIFVIVGNNAGLAQLPPGSSQPPTASAPAAKTTLAVLPFIPATADEKDLADRMRFAVEKKMSRDGNVDRVDAVQVDQTISALQIPWGPGEKPSADDLVNAIKTLGTQEVIFGTVQGRKLTLQLYQDGQLAKEVSATVPPDNESPRLTVEKLLTDLANVKFTHIREKEVDHDNPAFEAAFARNPNLAPDSGFEEAVKGREVKWDAILGGDHYAPPVIDTAAAKDLPQDKVAVVPSSFAGDKGDGHCLMMRMSKGTAEGNGLACVSDWIPVEDSATYRFSVRYRDNAPTLRIFLKGFAVKYDEFSEKDKPETFRREFYRAQVLPRGANNKWGLMEMDFTPSAIKPEFKIQWLRVDLYMITPEGDAFFDDVTVKKIAEAPGKEGSNK